jgi:hypothetical protein
MPRLNLPLNGSLNSDSCCSGPGLDGGCGAESADGPGSDVDGPGSDGGYGPVDGPRSDGGYAHVDGPGFDGACGLFDGPGSDSDGSYGLFNGRGSDGGYGGGWSSVGPGLDRRRFTYVSKLPCRGGGLESCDGDELGDFEIAHISYHDQGDIVTSDGHSEPVEWESESEPSVDSWLG